MTTVKWHEGHMTALDFEATGTNPLTDRAVTAAIVHAPASGRPRSINWVINPGIPIPDEAAAVHGWTTERLTEFLQGAEAIRIHGGRQTPMARDGALFEIAGQVSTVMAAGTPLVVHNAAYDLTLMETELARHDIDTLSSRPVGIAGVIDPMVLEKQYDPYRKLCYRAPGCNAEEKIHECSGCRGGKHRCGGCAAHDKTLTGLCQHYGIVHAGAHDADADAVAAIRLARKLAAVWPDAARLRLPTLHSHQVGWRRAQADSLRAYFDKAGIEHDGIDNGWPLHTSIRPSQAGAA